MDQKYFQNYENILEIVSEMFQEFPIFTIILSLNQPTDSEQFLNNGNSPLVFISAQQVSKLMLYKDLIIPDLIHFIRFLLFYALKPASKKNCHFHGED